MKHAQCIAGMLSESGNPLFASDRLARYFEAFTGVVGSDSRRRNFEAGWSQYSDCVAETPAGFDSWPSTDFHSVAKDTSKEAFSLAATLCMCSMVATNVGPPALTESGACGVTAETRTSATSLSRRYVSIPWKLQ